MLGCAAITPVMPRMLLGPTMRVKEEKPNELRLDATRRRRSCWCEDGARIVRVVWSVLEGLCPRPVLERLIHALEIMKSERAIVSRIGATVLEVGDGNGGTERRAEEGLPEAGGPCVSLPGGAKLSEEASCC
jgi:hypothetical protein